MITIASKRNKIENLLKKYPNAIIADVTSKATDGLVRLSPFYPHGGIPVQFSEGYTAACVEGVWQGLKVFEGEDIDISMFRNDTMKDIKRTVRKHGNSSFWTIILSMLWMMRVNSISSLHNIYRSFLSV